MPTGTGTYGKKRGRPKKGAGNKPRGRYSPGSPRPKKKK